MNTNTTRKARNTRNTNTKAPASVDVTATLAALAEQIAALTALVTATPAPASVGTPVKAKASKALTPAKAKEQAARKAKSDSIKAAREAGAQMPYDKALSLAAARIVHNRKQAAKGVEFINAAIYDTSPTSVRVWLTSAEHQAYKASRDNAGVSASDSEANLVAAVAKASKAK